MREFYLAGGTGLALHLGHRFSVDLDFFSESENAVDGHARAAIKKKFRDATLQLTHDKDATFVAMWRGVGISFFELSSNPLIEKTIRIDKVRLAGIAEIGAMKLAAVIGRGTRKDLVDLYFVLQYVSIEHLFRIAAKKYPQRPAFSLMALRGMAYFDDAEKLPMPQMLDPTSWRVMKKFLEQQALDAGYKKLEKYWD